MTTKNADTQIAALVMVRNALQERDIDVHQVLGVENFINEAPAIYPSGREIPVGIYCLVSVKLLVPLHEAACGTLAESLDLKMR